MTAATKLLKQAQRLGAAGFRVFPMHVRDGKVCRVNGWPEKATTDAEAIAKLWRGREVVAIAIATGEDWTVVDLDVPGERHQHDGAASLEAAGIVLPATLTVRTKSGGSHAFYRTAGAARRSVAAVEHPERGKLRGVDVRGAGGFVKVHDAAALLAGADAIANAPEWLPLADAAAEGGSARRTSSGDLEAWLGAERKGKSKPSRATRDAVEAVPLEGVGNGDLPAVLRPIVQATLDRRGRQWAYDTARERYLRNYPGADFAKAFDVDFSRLAAEAIPRTLTHTFRFDSKAAKRPAPVEDGAGLLEEVRAWLQRFILPMRSDDLDVLTLWAAHTHAGASLYTSPRLQLDSPSPGSGKTTVLEHLKRLCLDPVVAASLSSPALLVRILRDGPRTLLLDEVDRTLDPKRDSTAELVAILNSGYKVGATRPVLIPTGGEEGWSAVEMATFAPVALAGNSPLLPDDVKQRTISVLLVPDVGGQCEESDWERIEGDAKALGKRLSRWVSGSEAALKAASRELPAPVVGRARERWLPLKRIAIAAGGRWPATVDALAADDVAERLADIAEGLVTERPAMVVLRHIHEVWHEAETFIPTQQLVDRLAGYFPEEWGPLSPFGKKLTPQRLGRMLATCYHVRAAKNDRDVRGYHFAAFTTSWRRFGIDGPPGRAMADPTLIPIDTHRRKA